MITFDAFHLPGISPTDLKLQSVQCGDVAIRWPDLDRSTVEQLCVAISSNREGVLVDTSVNGVVTAIDQAAAHLQDNLTVHAQLISACTGYSEAVVLETLGHMFADWRADALHEMLRAELRDATVLDQPVPVPSVHGKRVAAYGFPLSFHVFSGNVPGVAVTSLVRSLLVKSATLGKLASGEPILPVLFARALAQVAPDIASCIALAYWPSDRVEITNGAIEAADAIVIYGGADTVEQLRARIAAHKHVVVHGPKLSFGVVGSARTAVDAMHVASAVAAYDQQGCVSPHVVYVHGDEENAREFARDVARQLQVINEKLPRGNITTEEVLAIRNARTAAEFGDDSELFGEENAAHSVIFERNPGFRASCLNRVLYVKPLRDLRDLPALLPTRDVLQSAALAGFTDEEQAQLVRWLGLSGVSRVTSFQQLPWPPMHWHHDGSPPLGELIRWQDIEA